MHFGVYLSSFSIWMPLTGASSVLSNRLRRPRCVKVTPIGTIARNKVTCLDTLLVSCFVIVRILSEKKMFLELVRVLDVILSHFRRSTAGTRMQSARMYRRNTLVDILSVVAVKTSNDLTLLFHV